MVRHWVLVPAFAGSNPAGSAKTKIESLLSDFCFARAGFRIHILPAQLFDFTPEYGVFFTR